MGSSDSQTPPEADSDIDRRADAEQDLDAELDSLLTQIDESIERVRAQSEEAADRSDQEILEALERGEAITDEGTVEAPPHPPNAADPDPADPDAANPDPANPDPADTDAAGTGPAEPGPAETEPIEAGASQASASGDDLAALDEALAGADFPETEAPAEHAGSAQQPDADVSAGIDSLLDELDDPEREPEPREDEATPETQPPARKNDRAVETSEGEDDLPDALEEPNAAENVDQLDRELADLIEDDLRGAPTPPPPEPEEAKPAEATSKPAEDRSDSSRGEEVPAAPTLHDTAFPERPIDGEWRDWLGYMWTVLCWLVPRAAARLGSLTIRGIETASPAVARGIEASDRPIQSKPPLVRSAIGWVAMYTAFLAVCVWGYLLLFRSPETPEPRSTPVRVIEGDAGG